LDEPILMLTARFIFSSSSLDNFSIPPSQVPENKLYLRKQHNMGIVTFLIGLVFLLLRGKIPF